MKKVLSLILALVLCLSLVACGRSPIQNNDPNGSANSDASNNVVDNTPVINVGEKTTTDKCEFYIDYINITKDVTPPQPGKWYSHYEAESGKIYVDLCVAYKNTDTSKIVAEDTISGKLIYCGKYEYNGFSMIEEDNRSAFTYSNITSIAPLVTEYVHYLFSVPEEVGNSGSEIVLKMNIGGNSYKIIVREGSGATTGDSNAQPGKASGSVELKEVVVTKNAEFYVDYANITTDVIPPQPGKWYSHYVADDGKVYVDICFAYKNLRGTNIRADDVISAKLTYAEKYEYKGYSMIEEDNRSDFTYSNITNIAPLTTEYVHYLFAVPEDLQSSKDSIEITFTIDGNTYTYKIR